MILMPHAVEVGVAAHGHMEIRRIPQGDLVKREAVGVETCSSRGQFCVSGDTAARAKSHHVMADPVWLTSIGMWPRPSIVPKPMMPAPWALSAVIRGRHPPPAESIRAATLAGVGVVISRIAGAVNGRAGVHEQGYSRGIRIGAMRNRVIRSVGRSSTAAPGAGVQSVLNGAGVEQRLGVRGRPAASGGQLGR